MVKGNALYCSCTLLDTVSVASTMTTDFIDFFISDEIHLIYYSLYWKWYNLFFGLCHVCTCVKFTVAFIHGCCRLQQPSFTSWLSISRVPIITQTHLFLITSLSCFLPAWVRFLFSCTVIAPVVSEVLPSLLLLVWFVKSTTFYLVVFFSFLLVV